MCKKNVQTARMRIAKCSRQMRKYYNVGLSITNNIKAIVINFFVYILITLFNSSICY